ncbi:MAG: glycosyltransferase [Cryomorphaceae bacterium]|nr:glycosyltransferase [Cryomorphaceae bacterium]
MKRPTISIIIPLYNVGSLLNKCIQSVLGQTYRELEIICVNDNSSDDTVEITEQLMQSDSRIKLFHNTKKGPGNARNMGIENATGMFITFLDSDDHLDANFIENYVGDLLNNIIDFVVGFPNCYDFSLGKIISNDYFLESEKNINRIVGDNQMLSKHFIHQTLPYIPVVPWAKMYRLDFIKKHDIRFAGESLHEDFLFMMGCIMHAESIAFSPHKNYNYITNRPGSITHKPSKKYYLDISVIFKTIENKLLPEDFAIYKNSTTGEKGEKSPEICAKFLQSYQVFKSKHLIRWMKDSILNPNLDNFDRKKLFHYARKHVCKGTSKSPFTAIEKIECMLFRWRAFQLFKLKTHLDVLKSKLI